jgi:hypothetical protein
MWRQYYTNTITIVRSYIKFSILIIDEIQSDKYYSNEYNLLKKKKESYN